MASYSLLASSSTVQVKGANVVQDVVYCTIQTTVSGVIASVPVDQGTFDSGGAGPELTAFADNIETIMGRGHVIAGVGSQTIDPSGLILDQVTFTVEYVPTGTSGTSITAEANVPVNLLSIDDPTIDRVLLDEAEAIIDGVYANLKAAAGD